MTINFTAFRTALVVWATSTGLSSTQVRWTDSNVPQPVLRPYISMKISLDEGQEFTDIEYDFLLNEKKELGTHAVTVSIQVIESVNNQGNSLHMEAAAKLRAALNWRAMKENFEDACASCFDRGRILDATQYLETEFEPKAVFDLRFYVASVDTEILDLNSGTFIERVTISGEGSTLDIQS